MLADWRIARTFSRDIWVTSIAWSTAAFAYFGVQGVLLNLYLLRLGFSLEFIGLFIGAGQIVWAVAAFPAGAVGRRIGLRAALVLSHVLLAGGLSLLLLVEALPRPLWPVWLYGSWAVMWIGASFQAVNSNPYMMHLARPEERNHAFVTQSAVQVLMAFIGSVVAGQLPALAVAQFGGSLDDPGPYRLGLWLGPVLYATGGLMRFGARRVNLPVETQTVDRAAAPLGLFALLGLFTLLQTASEGTVRAFFNVYLDVALNVPIAQIGTILGVGQFLSIFVVVVLPGLLKRWGTMAVLLASTVGSGLAMLPMAAFQHWLPAALSFVAIMATTLVGSTARGLLTQTSVLPRWQTTSSAVSIVGLAVGWASGAGVAGYLVGQAGFGALFYLCAGVSAAAALLLGTFGWRRSTAV